MIQELFRSRDTDLVEVRSDPGIWMLKSLPGDRAPDKDQCIKGTNQPYWHLVVIPSECTEGLIQNLETVLIRGYWRDANHTRVPLQRPSGNCSQPSVLGRAAQSFK